MKFPYTMCVCVCVCVYFHMQCVCIQCVCIQYVCIQCVCIQCVCIQCVCMPLLRHLMTQRSNSQAQFALINNKMYILHFGSICDDFQVSYGNSGHKSTSMGPPDRIIKLFELLNCCILYTVLLYTLVMVQCILFTYASYAPQEALWLCVKAMVGVIS